MCIRDSKNIDAPELFAAGLGHIADLRIVQHVADMGRYLALIADARDCLGHGVGILVDGKNPRALAREQYRGGTAIAPARPDAAGPGDQRNFSLYASRHEAFPGHYL